MIVIIYIRFTDVPCVVPTVVEKLWNIISVYLENNNYHVSDFKPYTAKNNYSRLPKEYHFKFFIEDADKFRGVGISVENLKKAVNEIRLLPEFSEIEPNLAAFDMYF